MKFAPVLFVVALVVFLLLLFRLRGGLRCVSWLVGLACLIGFLALISMQH
jgi:hypothetical protein